MLANKKLLIIFIFLGSLFLVNAAKAEETGCCETYDALGGTVYRTLTKTNCDNYGRSGEPKYTPKFETGKQASSDGKSCIDKPVAKTADGPSKIVAPVLSVSIPGFTKFSEVKCDDPSTACQIPWLAEYIKALYKYSISLIGILAVIVMMIGGVMWLTAGGNKERISSATNFIKGGVMGIIIALCSYALLFILNPNLVILSPLNINYIKKEDLDEMPDVDLSKSAEELGISEQELSTLKGENPYQAGCHNIEKCKQFGNTRPAGLVQIEAKYGNSSHYAEPKAYEAFKKAMDCVNKNKIMFKIYSGQRTAQRQIEIKAEKGGMAASPCCSNHGSGAAFDLETVGHGKMTWEYNESSGLKKCMNENGLYAKLTGNPNEPWHWSPSGR